MEYRDFDASKVVGGTSVADNQSYRILYAGTDPANSDRILVRKLFQVQPQLYAYEEVRMDPLKGTVHSQVHRIRGDLKEETDNTEEWFRRMYRPTPNLVSYSLFWRDLGEGRKHVSIVEGPYWK